MGNKTAVLAVIGIILLAVVAYVALKPAPEPEVVSAPVPTQTPEPVVREPEPVPEVEEEPAPEPTQELIAPPTSLTESDERWLSVASTLSPALVQWLVGEEQIRKWVILIDQIADGDLSTKHLPLKYPMEKFIIEGDKDLAKVSAQNYQRAVPLIDAVTTIKPELLVSYYRLWQPLFEQAYGELGKPGTFDDRVAQAIRQLQSVPPGPVGAEIAARPVMFKYLDPKFEKAPALHKWMWRMGPENQARIKQYLTEVKLALYRQQ